jgi:hypothetical protein
MTSHEALLWTVLPSVVGAVLLAALFLPRFRLATLKTPPDLTLAYIADRLRRQGRRVRVDRDHLSVRIGSFSAVKLWAKPGMEGVVRFQADATPRGWSLVMFLFFFGLAPFGVVGILATATVIAIFVRALVFARRLAATLPADGEIPEASSIADVDALLLGALAEGHRLAAEAYEAHRSSYWDGQVIVLAAAIVAWAVTLVAIVTSGSWWIDRPLDPFLYAIAGGAAVALPAGSLVWRRYGARLHEMRAWSIRLESAWLQQAGRASPSDTEPSTFELLAEASSHVPAWIDVSRRSGFLEAPHTGFLAPVLAFYAFSLFIGGSSLLIGGSTAIGALLLGGGVLLAVGAHRLNRQWRHAQDSAGRRLLSDWTNRYDAIRGRMERFLQDL